MWSDTYSLNTQTIQLRSSSNSTFMPSLAHNRRSLCIVSTMSDEPPLVSDPARDAGISLSIDDSPSTGSKMQPMFSQVLTKSRCCSCTACLSLRYVLVSVLCACDCACLACLSSRDVMTHSGGHFGIMLSPVEDSSTVVSYTNLLAFAVRQRLECVRRALML